MKVVPVRPFEDYFKACGDVESASLVENAQGVRGLRAVHDCIAGLLQEPAEKPEPVSTFLSFNAFMLFLAAVRIAFSGHVAAVFPVLRTALESVSYAYLMIDDPTLVSIWSKRHKDEASLKACRRIFTSAVSQVADKFDEIQPESGDLLRDAYEASIDFGAHPNTRSIFSHVTTAETEDVFEVTLAGVYAHDAFETRRAQLACWDFGLAIAIILTRAKGELTQERADRLHALNDAKEAYVSSLTSGGT